MRARPGVCNVCGEAFLMGCVQTDMCPQCRAVATCRECDGTGTGECPSGQCDGRWHRCLFCDIKPKDYIDSLASDAALAEFLAAHPLHAHEALRVERSVQRVRALLRGEKLPKKS